MAQPAQPNANGKRKFNWTSFIVSLILIGSLLGLILYFSGVFNRSISNKSITHFETRMAENAADDNDDNYFERVEFREYSYDIYVVERVEGVSTTYTVRAPRSYQGEVISKDIAHPVYGTWAEFMDATLVYHDSDGEQQEGSLGHAAPPATTNWWSIVISFLPMVLIIGFFIWMFKRQGGAGEIFNTGKNQARKVSSKKRFSDIAGQEEVKEEVMEVVDFMKFPDKYKAAGARIPKGIMLGGPPGTGKTLLAKATAGEAGVPFYFISASNFVEMFAGLGAKRVREMFKDARKAAPAILFIDELDAIGRKRGSSLSGNDEREQTLNQILVEMDGMDENTGLLVIAATNRPDVLDPALMRPGRFDRTITVNNPDVKERAAILELHARGKRVSSDVDFALIAKRTPGYSGAQLENIINEAALLSVRERTGIITLDQVDEAIDRVAAGPAKKSRTITQKELQMVAYHEAGHAVIGMKIAAAEKVQKITIIPRGQAGGYTLMTPKEEKYNYSKSELLSKVMSFMGGRAAEQIIYGAGEVSTGASNDIERATAIARAMVTQYGMSSLGPIAYERDMGAQYLGSDQRSKEYSDALAERIDEAIREIIIEAEKKAIETIKKHRTTLDLIAEELLEKETIVAEEIQYINDHNKRPPKRVVSTETKGEMQSLSNIIDEVKQEAKTETKPEVKVEEPKEEKPSKKEEPSKGE